MKHMFRKYSKSILKKALNSIYSPWNISGHYNKFDKNSQHYLVSNKLKAIYCSIPKNACTLFKSMMVENSNDVNEFDIKRENVHEYLLRKGKQADVYNYNLSSINHSDYFKFVILRNPFNRIVSAYLDKFAKRPKPQQFAADMIKEIQTSQGEKFDLHKSISFSQFINYLVSKKDKELNDHWRPQTFFLKDVIFDYYGNFENLEKVIEYLELKFAIKVNQYVAIANITNHQTEYGNINDNLDFSNMYPNELRQLKYMPLSDLIFTDELREKFAYRYRQDIALYNEKFGCI